MATDVLSPIKPIEVPPEARDLKIAFCELVALAYDIYSTKVKFVEMVPGQKPNPQEVGVNSSGLSIDQIVTALLNVDRYVDGGGGRVMRAAKKYADKIDQNGGNSRNTYYSGGSSSGIGGGGI